MFCKHIFVIDGAAGTGKSDLLEFVEHHIVGYNATILKKVTTRHMREEEKRTNKSLDLKFVSDEEFDQYIEKGDFYWYKYPHNGVERYGFFKSDLEDKLHKYDNVFLIVRNATTIKKIRQDFSDVNIIPIFVYTIESLIENRLREEGYKDYEIEYRIKRSSDAMSELYTHPTLYKVHIINNSDKSTFQKQLKENFDELVKPCPDILRITSCEHYHLPAVLQPHKSRMLAKLQKYKFEKNVFIMMKYQSGNQAIFDIIQLAVESVGFNCIRADMNEWSITKNDVYNPFAVLFCCKYGIALFDELEVKNIYNTNVAIELAMMHFQDKHCLMLKHKSLPSPPFDLAAKIYIEYLHSADLVSIIKNWLSRL